MLKILINRKYSFYNIDIFYLIGSIGIHNFHYIILGYIMRFKSRRIYDINVIYIVLVIVTIVKGNSRCFAKNGINKQSFTT